MAMATLMIPRENTLNYLDVTDEEREKMSQIGFDGLTDKELASLAEADEDRWHEHGNDNNYLWDVPW